jgi:hypothetical protein
MPKMKLFRVSGYCRVTATTAPTCSLNNACAGPANLSASTSPLDVRSPCSGDGECGKGATDFHELSRAPPAAQIELATPVHSCVVAKVFLPAWENGVRLKTKNNGTYGLHFESMNSTNSSRLPFASSLNDVEMM